ncbi:MAG: hypothetical protein ACREXT_09210 [Gammaproteobacteria bacterium]
MLRTLAVLALAIAFLAMSFFGGMVQRIATEVVASDAGKLGVVLALVGLGLFIMWIAKRL